MKPIHTYLPALLAIAIPSGVMAAELGGDYVNSLCPTSLDIPARPLVDIELEQDDIHLIADETNLVENGISTLTGNAEITRNTQQATADHIEYDQPRDTADIKGNVNYWDEALFLDSHDAFLTLDNGIGEFTNADYTLINRRGRGTADKLVLDVGTRTDLEEVEYSTCDPEDNFWALEASKVSLDHDNNRGTARNVFIKIKNVPVFYSPYLSFPLSQERKSGFLAPGYGQTTQHGLEVSTPYYWNISPNTDATLTPRFFTNSGMMAIGEYRYLFEQGSGTIGLEYLPSDSQFNDNHRNLLDVNLSQTFAGINFLVDYSRASDKFYFENFGNQLSVTSTSYLNQYAQLSYSKSNWSILAAVQNYQITSPGIPDTSKPYKKLPQVHINYAKPEKNRSLNYGLSSQVAYFYRDTGLVGDFNGLRTDIRPYISYPMSNIYSFIKPRLGLRYTQYALDDNPTFDTSPSRVLPIFSLDSGLFFERDVSMFKNNYRQTLEPRLFYLYIPREDQSDLPVFDTGLYTFSFDSLFYEDRFNSVDRVGDANQITAAVTSRFIDAESGRSLGAISLGQVFYFRDREVTLPDQAIRDEETSSFIAAFNTSIIKNTHISGDFQWNPYVAGSTEKITLQASYRPAPGKVLNMSYRVVRSNEINTVTNTNDLGTGIATADIDQADLSFRWPVTQNWSAVGRWNYAVPERRSLELFGGVEYESCCWGVRAVARRFLSSIDGEFDTGIFLQMELKGLAGVGKKTVDFLKQQISGYQSEF